MCAYASAFMRDGLPFQQLPGALKQTESVLCCRFTLIKESVQTRDLLEREIHKRDFV